ncbi:phosphoribosyltransferase family protein [Nocardia sp. NPDC050712]|uniref:phosphoribosyltransferase n=1 Tax=Nocardia sp. NPDC050712 TaxID=3155518 RepID=UPI0033CC8FC2
MPFHDRRDAGRRLAERLRGFHGPDVVVLAVPRGGVPVACEVAAALGLPLEVEVVRKLRVPFQPGLVFGAIAANGVQVIDEPILLRAFVSDPERHRVTREARNTLSRSIIRYRGAMTPFRLDGRTAVIVDDGVATGATARAAIEVARSRGAERVILAVPVGSPRAIRSLSRTADIVVCLETPAMFHSIAQWYQRFDDVTDTAVCELLARPSPPKPPVVLPAEVDPVL